MLSNPKLIKINSNDSKLETKSNASSNPESRNNASSSNKIINFIPVKKPKIPTQKLKDSIKEKIEISIREKDNVIKLKDNYPLSARNSSTKKVCFETNKYAQKIYNNVKIELNHKSPSPNSRDYNVGNLASTSNNLNKNNKIS